MSLRGRKVRGWKEDADENDDTSLLCLAPLAKKRNIRLENEPDDTSTGSDELTLEYLFTNPASPSPDGSCYIKYVPVEVLAVILEFTGVSTILRSCATCRQFLGAKAHALQAVGCRLVAPNPIDLTDTSNSFMFTNRAMTRDGNVVPYWEFSQSNPALVFSARKALPCVRGRSGCTTGECEEEERTAIVNSSSSHRAPWLRVAFYRMPHPTPTSLNTHIPQPNGYRVVFESCPDEVLLGWLQELLQWGLDIQEVGLLGCGEAALSLMAKHMPQLPSLVYDPRRPIDLSRLPPSPIKLANVRQMRIGLVSRSLGLGMPYLRQFPSLKSLAIDFGRVHQATMGSSRTVMDSRYDIQSIPRPILTSHKLEDLTIKNPAGVSVACSTLHRLRLETPKFTYDMMTLAITHNTLQFIKIKYQPERPSGSRGQNQLHRQLSHKPAEIQKHFAFLTEVLSRQAPALEELLLEVDSTLSRRFSRADLQTTGPVDFAQSAMRWWHRTFSKKDINEADTHDEHFALRWSTLKKHQQQAPKRMMVRSITAPNLACAVINNKDSATLVESQSLKVTREPAGTSRGVPPVTKLYKHSPGNRNVGVEIGGEVVGPPQPPSPRTLARRSGSAYF